MHIFWTTSRKLAHSWLEHPPEFWWLFTGENGDFTMGLCLFGFPGGFPSFWKSRLSDFLSEICSFHVSWKFSGAQLHTNNTWFSLRKATGRARSTGHSQGLGCLGVRVSTWLMANAKQYLICRICAIYFWPTKNSAGSYFKQQTRSVMSCSSSRGERLFLCNEKRPVLFGLLMNSYRSLRKGYDGPW